MDRRYSIFVSSTYEDLIEEREKVIRTVLEQGCFPICMEHFPAVGIPPIAFIQKVLKECDYYILIIGARYGSIGVKGISFTEEEYDFAIDKGIPVLAFLHSNIKSIPIGKSDEKGKNRKKLVAFREKVKKGNQTIKYWNNPDELAGLVSLSISSAIKLHNRRGWVRGKQDYISPQNLEVVKILKSYVIKIDDVEFKMIYIEDGTFSMGATLEQEKYAEENERPSHSVTLDEYWIGETPVTQALWVKIMGYNPSYFSQSHGYKDDLRLPVEQVTWNECKKFIDKLNMMLMNKLKGSIKFDFPTEAQWEFAARGGNKSGHYVCAGTDYNELDTVAWYDHNSLGKTWPVAGLEPNELGLYDMSGNVWEWCKTLFSDYSGGSKEDTNGKIVGRGGCWHSEKKCCRVSYRAKANMAHAGNGLGLRLVLNKMRTDNNSSVI